MRRAALLLFVACARPASDAGDVVQMLTPPAYEHDTYEGASARLPPGISWAELSAKNPHATALCKEVFPCDRPRAGDGGDPFMCALAGIRNVAPEQIPGVRVESVVCPYRRLGEGGIFGVPLDGSRPLLTEEQLASRAAGHPRLRAILASGGLIDESFCPTTLRGDHVSFCVRSGQHCTLAPGDSVPACSP